MPRTTYNVKEKLIQVLPSLREDLIDEFLAICEFHSLKNKQILFKSGTASRTAAFILEGVIRGYYVNTSGVEINSILRVENTFVGVPEWLSEKAITKYNFESIFDSKVITFNLEALEALAIKYPPLFHYYINGYKETVITLLGRVESAIDKTPEQRYLELLEKSPLFISKAFNKHIANYLGITPVSLSRIIKRVKDLKPKTP
ncbi:MAG: CRP-like cAMP-binding protein [Psychromonas sp.]|jgi:CRP-like cAMP-binding protein